MGQAAGSLDSAKEGAGEVQEASFDDANVNVDGALRQFLEPSACQASDVETHDVTALRHCHGPPPSPNAMVAVRLPQGLSSETLHRVFRKAILDKLLEANFVTCAIPRLLRAYMTILQEFRDHAVGGKLSQNERSQKLVVLAETSEIIHLLLKCLTEELGTVDVLYHIEYTAPVFRRQTGAYHQPDVAASLLDLGTLPDGHVRITYKGQCYATFAVPNNQRDKNKGTRGEDVTPESLLRACMSSYVTTGADGLGESKDQHKATSVCHGSNPIDLRTCVLREHHTGNVMTWEGFVSHVQHVRKCCVALVPLQLCPPSTTYDDLASNVASSVLHELFIEATMFSTMTAPLLLSASAFYIARVHTTLLEAFVRLFSLLVAYNPSRDNEDDRRRDIVTTTFPLYFIQSESATCRTTAGPRACEFETIMSPCLTAFLELMDALHGGGRTLPTRLIHYLLTTIWMNTGYLRQSVRLSQAIAPFDVLLPEKPLPPDLFTQSALAARLFAASMATLCIVVFHPAHHVTHTTLPTATFEVAGATTRSSSQTSASNVLAKLFAEATDLNYFGGTTRSDSEAGRGTEHRQISLQTLPLSFDAILAAFCSRDLLVSHLAPLVFYALVYRNRSFRLFCQSRLDSQHFVLPILQVIYEMTCFDHDTPDPRAASAVPATETVQSPLSPAATLLLLVLLILSKDTNFCAFLFSSGLATLPSWYMTPQQRRQWEARPTSTILGARSRLTVGCLAILVVLRAISWNIGKCSDLFGHEVCGALLLNMARHIKDLHWLLAEKLIQFLRRLLRQHLRRLPSLWESSAAHVPLPPHPFVVLEELCTTTQGAETPGGTSFRDEVHTVASVSELHLKTCSEDNTPAVTKSVMASSDMQGSLTVLRALLIALCTMLSPCGSHDASTTADLDEEVPQQQQHAEAVCCSLTVFHALLRSEETLSALQQMQEHCEKILQRQADLKRDIRYLQESHDQYHVYHTYRTQRCQKDTRGGRADVVANNESVVLPQWSSLQQLVPRLEQLSELPVLPVPPAPPVHELMALEHLVAFVAPLLPYIQFLLDLSALLLTHGAKEGEAVEETLQRLCHISQQLKQEVPAASDEQRHYLERLRLFERTMMPRTAFSYSEVESSCDYFLPILWKTIHMEEK